MTAPYSDQFQVINGPEDGAEYPLTRTPADVGSDPGCAIHMRMDQSLRMYHARVTVVSDGYRVRALGGGGVFVNGKRTGMTKSRVMRSGDILRVGSTELVLECVPDGLASRSRGMPMESDLVWTAKIAWKGARRFTRGIMFGLRGSFGSAIWIIPLAALGLFLLWRYQPGIVRGGIQNINGWLYWLRMQAGQLLGG